MTLGISTASAFPWQSGSSAGQATHKISSFMSDWSSIPHKFVYCYRQSLWNHTMQVDIIIISDCWVFGHSKAGIVLGSFQLPSWVTGWPMIQWECAPSLKCLVDSFTQVMPGLQAQTTWGWRHNPVFLGKELASPLFVRSLNWLFHKRFLLS